MFVMLHEKRNMSRLCQNMTIILNPRITSSGTREIVVHTTGGTQDHISLRKEFHKCLFEYNVAMEGDDNPCISHFQLWRCFGYGIGKDIARFRNS